MSTRICIFGDSITWGKYDPQGGGWANRLRNYFEKHKQGIIVYNLGLSYDLIKQLHKRLLADCKSRLPQTIIISAGINDSRRLSSQGNTETSIKIFKQGLKELLNQSKKFTNQIYFTSLIKIDETHTQPATELGSPDETIYYKSKTVRQYNSTIQKFCKQNNVPFIDFYNLLSKKDLYDGLHPNTQGHKKIFEKVKKELKNICKK